MVGTSIFLYTVGVVCFFCGAFFGMEEQLHFAAFCSILLGVMLCFVKMAINKHKQEQEERERAQRMLEENERKLQEARKAQEKLEAERKAKEYDIIPNRPYDKALSKARKLKWSDNQKNKKLGEFFEKLLLSKQYLVQKQVMMTSNAMEHCINFWPEIFDGIKVYTDDNGNGTPDEFEEGDDYFEVSKSS